MAERKTPRTLRPSAVDEIRRIEEGPADEWKARPATPGATPAKKTRGARIVETAPSNGAGSRGLLATIQESEAAA